MTTLETGNRAEEVAASYLESKCFDIISRNYRRRHCEIDIVARKDCRIYFVEVKYRMNNDQGTGLDAISYSKMLHMQRGAETWTKEYNWSGEYQLAAVEISGDAYEVTAFVDDMFI